MSRIRFSMKSAITASMLLAALAGNAVAADAASSAGPSTAGNLLQVTLGLMVVLGLMAAAAWLLRRFNMAKGGNAANIKIIGGVSVGNRERVILVEVADQWIVVGVAPGRVNALTTMARQETTVATDAAPPSRDFSSWLAQTIDKRNGQ